MGKRDGDLPGGPATGTVLAGEPGSTARRWSRRPHAWPAHRIGRIGPQRSGSTRSTSALEDALGYAAFHRWPLVPGSQQRRDRTGVWCTCGDPACADPQPHPAPHNGVLAATTDLATLSSWWEQSPDAPVLAATGHVFDVVDVPEAAGRRTLLQLERLGAPLGPVVYAPETDGGTVHFFTEPGAAADLPGLLARIGWYGSTGDLRALGVRVRGAGAWVELPAGASASRWIREPQRGGTLRVPGARLLLGPVTYACRAVR